MYLVASCGDVPFQVELAKKSHQLLLTCTWKLGHLKCYRQTMEGSSRKLCEKLAMEIVRGSPYHPQSWGKVERSHQALRKKILFGMAYLNKKWGDWAIQLKEYQKLQNEESMEALGCQSPFQVFYGRETNAVKNVAQGGRCVKGITSSKEKLSKETWNYSITRSDMSILKHTVKSSCGVFVEDITSITVA